VRGSSSFWHALLGGYQQQYRPNYKPLSAYVVNVVPSHSHNTPRPPTTYRPPLAPNNVFQPRTGGPSFNQAQSQGYGQRSNNSGEKVVNFTLIPMTYT